MSVCGVCPLGKLTRDEQKILAAYRNLKKTPGGGKLSVRIARENGRKFVDVEKVEKFGRENITE